MNGSEMRQRAWSVPAIALVMVGAAIILRYASLGDPNIQVDESWYLQVGHEMHLGAVPYVDIWDRKPPSLFLLYWFFAGAPHPVLAYQLGALVSVALTALVIAQIAGFWCRHQGAVLAGIAYIALVNAMGGEGGQSPVYYNLPVAGAALLLLHWREARKDWQLLLAMLLLGVAISFKHTVVFEAVFFGLWSAWQHRSPRLIIASVILGIAPFLAYALWYAWHGYWPQFYHAMVTSNTTRPLFRAKAAIAENAFWLAIDIWVLLLVVTQAFLFYRKNFDWMFVGLWLMAALVGFASVPVLNHHYALPLMVPMCVAAALVFDRERLGIALAMALIIYAAVIGRAFDITGHRRSAQSFQRQVDLARPTSPNGGLFIADGPPLLYMATGQRPMTPLSFPTHLEADYEKNTSHLDSSAELRRVMAQHPDVVVMNDPVRYTVDPESWAILTQYVHTQCLPPIRLRVFEFYGGTMTRLIYRGCGKDGRG